MKIKGTVSGVGKGKFSYFVTLAEKEGFYFNTKYEPKCSKGDTVGIEYTEKGENRGNVSKILVLVKGEEKFDDTPQERGSDGVLYKGRIFVDRQDSIVWQSSRKDALVLVGLLVQTETAKIPKGDKGRVVIEALLDEITVRFFHDAIDPKESAAFKLNNSIKEDTEVEEVPEAEDDPWDDTGKAEDEWEN